MLVARAIPPSKPLDARWANGAIPITTTLPYDEGSRAQASRRYARTAVGISPLNSRTARLQMSRSSSIVRITGMAVGKGVVNRLCEFYG
jgi:hypothetical protein